MLKFLPSGRAGSLRAWRAKASAITLTALVFGFPLPGYAGNVSYNYDALGRVIGVTYSNGSSLTYQYDAAGNRTQVSRTAVNIPPVAHDDSASTGYQAQVRLDPTINDTDGNGDTLTVTAVGSAGHGTTNFTEKSVIYTPAGGFSGSDSFSYTISDGHGGFASATVTVSVASPVAHTLQDRLLSGQALFVGTNLLSPNGQYNFTMQTDGNLVLYGPNGALWSTGTWGSSNSMLVMQTDGVLAVYNASRQNVWSIATNSPGGTLSLQNDGNVVVFNTSGGPVWSSGTNEIAPTANNDSVATGFNAPGSWDPRTNDTDPNNDPLTVTGASQGGHGSTSFTGGSVTYTPFTGYTGTDSFNYTISDGRGGTASATVYVAVGLPPAPTASDVSLSASYNGSGSAGLSPGGNYTSLGLASNASHGTASVNGTTAYYTPYSGYYGGDTFTYNVTGPGGTSAPATVTVNVGNPPAPSAGNVSMSVDYASSGSVGLSPGGVYNSVAMASGPSHGSAYVSGNTAYYTPSSTYSGSDSFTYTTSGPGGSATGTVSVDVAVPNRLLPGQSLAAGFGMRSPNGQYNLAMQSDGNLVIYGPGGATWSSSTYGSGANTAVLQGDGNFVLYAPGSAVWSSSTSGNAAESLRMQDDGNLVLYNTGGGAIWNSATPPNRAPTCSDGYVNLGAYYTDGTYWETVYDGDLLNQCSDPDGDNLTITNVSIWTDSGTSIDQRLPILNYPMNAYEIIHISYTVSDGKGGTTDANYTVERDLPAWQQ